MSIMLHLRADDWPDVVAVLTRSGKPWPRVAADCDLEWYQATTGKRPGRWLLQRRWGWSDWRVRRRLAEVERRS